MQKLKIRHIIIYLTLILFDSASLFAQERGLILSKYYSPTDYMAALQNWSIAQDQRGIMYFANSSCILEYDGSEWRRIDVPNNSSVRTIAIDSNNNIYAGAYDELGVLSPNKKGTLEYKSLTYLIDSSHSNFGDVWSIQCIGLQTFFLTDHYLFRYQNNKMKYWERTKKRFYLSFKIDSSLYVQEIGKGLLKLENDSLRLISKGEFFSDKRIHAILPYNNKLILCTRTKGMFLYDPNYKNGQIIPFSDISENAGNLNNFLLKNIFYHGIKISNNLYALSTIRGGVLLVDNKWNVVDVINQESTGVNSDAQYLYYQKNKCLWLALGNGICQVDILSPYRYWNDEKGINGNVSDVACLDDYIYVSTISGLYYISKKPDNTSYTINNFKPVKGKVEESWGFLYYALPNSDYKEIEKLIHGRSEKFYPSSDKLLLLVATSNGLLQLIGDKTIPISDYKGIYNIYQYKKDPSKIFLSLSTGIAELSYSNGKWSDLGMKYHISDKIKEINEDSTGTIWASAIYKGVYKIQNPLSKDENTKVKFYDTNNGLTSVQKVQFLDVKNKLYFLADTSTLVFDNELDSFILYHDPIISNEEDNKVPFDTAWYRVYNKMTSGFYVTTRSDSSVWFSTTDGIFRYFSKTKKNYSNIKPVLIREVLAEDSLIYDGTNFKIAPNNTFTDSANLIINTDSKIDLGTTLKFKDNSLFFHFSLPFYEDESKNVYSYYLEGYDKSWSPWSTKTKREYMNLKEGEYIFKVKAKNLYEIESPISEFKFKILPPWYRSFAAILGYIILGIILIIVIVRLYTYRLIKEKEKLEKIVIERTQEILMQKEEILVQAEHLKDANERISAKNEELEKQKWEITNQALKLKKANIELIKLSKVASETDNAIVIFDKEGNMEWVNDGFTRMYGYTFDQYKKEKNINIHNNSDNPNIQEAVRSCINNKTSVVYEFKTKTKNGKDIWAQTTLTHVVDKNGETINLIAIDTDITKIKLAEREILKQKKEIEEQRDKLAISNATKNKFFRIIAHDLRNPISTLAGSTNLIFNDFEEYNKEQTKGFIGELNKLSQKTFNLLENLLDWSTSQMGEIKYSPKPINMKLLSNENIELIKRKVNSKNISLTTDLPDECIAFADEDMVKTIIRNLLSNAVKFTPENGTIQISCSINKDFIKYSVKDSGIGISKEDQKKLFRIDAHHSTPGLSNEKGSGLGLILCKEFVEKNEGAIYITSEPNKGTTIEFTLKRHSV